VANAVFEQADALMLSGETTIGRYPVECVEVLRRVAVRIERSGGGRVMQRTHCWKTFVRRWWLRPSR